MASSGLGLSRWPLGTMAAYRLVPSVVFTQFHVV